MLLLVVVAFAAVIVPGVSGRRVFGSAVPAAVPPAPATADCVTAISPLPPVDVDTDESARTSYPSAVYGNCSGPIIGEVMSIDLTEHPLARATIGSYQHASSECELSEVNYVGSIGPFDPATITTPGIAWQADVSVQSLAIGPSALQRAAGQSWTACVGATPDRSPYRGRIGDALVDGVLPPAFATCWRSMMSSTEQQVAEMKVPCATPHPVEIIALTEIFDARTTPAQVNKSCVGMASRAFRTADPTRGGRLKIAAYSFTSSWLEPLTTVAAGSGFLGCVASVDDPARLTGTLIGIGSKPLPITG